MSIGSQGQGDNGWAKRRERYGQSGRSQYAGKPETPKPLKPHCLVGWLCSHCSRFAEAGSFTDMLDSGTTLTCEHCGGKTVVELRRG